jgi:hypothetical protein
MKKSYIQSALFSLMLLAPITHASVILNGGFEIPDIDGEFKTYTSSPAGFNWTITALGSSTYGVDLINSFWQGISGIVNSDGYDQSVDIDYASTLSQSFTTTPGVQYQLHFAYSHNYQSSLSKGHIDVTGTTSLLSATLTHDISNSASNMQWSPYDQVFTADSPTTILTFTGDSSNGPYGFAVDDVRIAPVPVPATLSLFGSGLVGLIGITRRKKAA